MATTDPIIPSTDVSPIWNPEFFGNCIVVNGRTWPYLEVAPRRYRFRLLNGCQSRFLILKFDDPMVDVWQIGSEGGYLRAPVQLKEILMSPAERADIIVDFAGVKFGKNVTLLNFGPDAPYGGGGFRRADPLTTGQVMQFRVNQSVPASFVDPTTPPAQLVMPTIPAPVIPDTDAAARAARTGGAVGRAGDPDRGAARNVRYERRRPHWHYLPQVGGSRHGEPDSGRRRKRGSSTTSPRMRTRYTFTRCSSR